MIVAVDAVFQVMELDAQAVAAHGLTGVLDEPGWYYLPQDDYVGKVEPHDGRFPYGPFKGYEECWHDLIQNYGYWVDVAE